MSKTIDYEFKRGDTSYLRKFRVFDKDKNPIVLTNSDQLYFTLKNTSNDQAYVLQKKINNGITLGEDGYYHIVLNPSDTNNLSYKDYVYDIELKGTVSGKTIVKTLIEGTITITDEVTWGVNE